MNFAWGLYIIVVLGFPRTRTPKSKNEWMNWTSCLFLVCWTPTNTQKSRSLIRHLTWQSPSPPLSSFLPLRINLVKPLISWTWAVRSGPRSDSGLDAYTNCEQECADNYAKSSYGYFNCVARCPISYTFVYFVDVYYDDFAY